MTDEQINIAISEACGLFGFERRGGILYGWHDMEKPGIPVPDYLNDLNAMHEAEKTLDSLCEKYAGTLGIVVEAENSKHEGWEHAETITMLYVFCHATARQRAEAFLRTIGKWTDS